MNDENYAHGSGAYGKTVSNKPPCPLGLGNRAIHKVSQRGTEPWVSSFFEKLSINIMLDGRALESILKVG